jgi:hypothetical protein
MRPVAITLAIAVCLLAVGPTLAAKSQAYPPNVYFNFTDGHGNKLTMPKAYFFKSAADCTNPAKLAEIAKGLQKQDKFWAPYTYVDAKCRASSPLAVKSR